MELEVTVRRGRPADARAIAELYLRARKAASKVGTIPPLAHSDDETREWIEHVVIPKLKLWVAESRTQGPVGMLVLDDDWIDQLYVDPALTGGGIGAMLLNVAKREFPGGLRLWTFVSNLGARRFYERHGFVEIERTDGSGNEEGAPDIQYALAPD